MEHEKSSSEKTAPVDPHAPPDLENGQIINGAYFTNSEISEFSEQNFLEPMETTEREKYPRISAVRFLTHCLPIILDERGAQRNKSGRNDDLTWLNMWAKEISENTRLPVILTGDTDADEEYTIPPPMGTIHTSNTGHKDSIEGRYNYYAMHSRHLLTNAEYIKKHMFNKIKVKTSLNDLYRDDWLRLLADAGELDEEYPATAQKYRSKEPNSVTRFMARRNGLKITATELPLVPAHPADAIYDGETTPPAPAEKPAGFSGSGGLMDYD